MTDRECKDCAYFIINIDPCRECDPLLGHDFFISIDDMIEILKARKK
jgi:hypothetical protein